MSEEQQKTKNWFARHKVLSVLLGLVVLAIIGGAASGTKTTSSQKSSVTTPTTDDNRTATAKPATQATGAQPAAQTVLLDITGNGSKQTQPFTTGKSWNVVYTYDCSDAGGTGNFQFDVSNTDSSLNTDTGANELAASGGNTDYFYDVGQHYLSINSECNWHVTVKG